MLFDPESVTIMWIYWTLMWIWIYNFMSKWAMCGKFLAFIVVIL